MNIDSTARFLSVLLDRADDFVSEFRTRMVATQLIRSVAATAAKYRAVRSTRRRFPATPQNVSRARRSRPFHRLARTDRASSARASARARSSNSLRCRRNYRENLFPSQNRPAFADKLPVSVAGCQAESIALRKLSRQTSRLLRGLHPLWPPRPLCDAFRYSER
jgi:hypothetical protein